MSYINPHVIVGSEMYNEGENHGYFIKNTEGLFKKIMLSKAFQSKLITTTLCKDIQVKTLSSNHSSPN